MLIKNLNQLVLNIESKINSNKQEEISPEELQILMYDKLKNIRNWMHFFGILTVFSISLVLFSYIFSITM